MEIISVIVPVYNVSPYLAQCLESLAAQDYEAMQFILVDDGSTDGSGGLCDAFAARDDRFTVIHQPNEGVSSARNRGLAAAAGTLIGFVDGDDWVDPGMYSALAGALAAGKADIAMCGYYEYLPDPTRPPLKQGTANAEAASVHDALYWCMTRHGYFTAVWNKLFRYDRICENDAPAPFSGDLAVGEDETWLMRTMARCRRFAFLPTPLYHWRSRVDSATRMPEITPGRMSILTAKRLAVDLVTPYGKDLTRLAKSRMYNDCYHLLIMAYCERNHAIYRQVRAALAPVRRDWLFCSDSPPLRKAKVLTLELLLAIHARRTLITRVYDARRRQAY